MSTEIRAILIHDPYGIHDGTAIVVRDTHSEQAAFMQIDRLLRQDSRLETISPQTYVIEAGCWEHFRSYRGMAGVRIEQITPRARLRERFAMDPPPWLTNERILQWRLLSHGESPVPPEGDWAATVAAWLVPGITETTSLSEWLRLTAAAASMPQPIDECPLLQWFVESFRRCAQRTIQYADFIQEWTSELTANRDVVAFSRTWVRRTALLPFTQPELSKRLVDASVKPESPRNCVLAKALPLVFPLPGALHEHVSLLFKKATQRCRLSQPDSFEQVVLSLNAVWDGVPGELRSWLNARPSALTTTSSSHLQALPGYHASEPLRQLIDQFGEVSPPPAWLGLGNEFDDWVARYAEYARRSFCRRQLPDTAADPALGFAKWLKANPDVCFNHIERGYRLVAKTIQDALQQQRRVVVILIDALAVHIVRQAIDYFSDVFNQQPTRLNYFITPVPTISEVCKEAVLTGAFPDECRGNLVATLRKSYRVSDQEVQVAGNWEDAERLQISRTTSLLVYRDNRLDDQLRTTATYQTLVEDCPNVFARIARLVDRWVSDMQSLGGARPLVLLTGDHGFTFGPPPGTPGGAGGGDGSHRCVTAGERSHSTEADDSMTYLDRRRFHVRSNYLAARGRYFGNNTISGWRLSHGGLLPEEVLVPLVQWFGNEQSVTWPTVEFPGPAYRDHGQWILQVVVTNSSPVAIPALTMSIRLGASNACCSWNVGLLQPGEHRTHSFSLPAAEPDDTTTLTLVVTCSAPPHESSQQVTHTVAVTRRLVERNCDQDAFESMF